jgi:hypothetical protein
LTIANAAYPKWRKALYLKARALDVAVPEGFSVSAEKPPGVPMRTLILDVEQAAKRRKLYAGPEDGTLNTAFQHFLIPPVPLDVNAQASRWLLAHLGPKENLGANSGTWLNEQEDAMGEAYMHTGHAPWCAAIGGRRAYQFAGIDVHHLWPSLNPDYCPSWETHIRSGAVSTDHRYRFIMVNWAVPSARRYGDIILYDWPTRDGVSDHFGHYLEPSERYPGLLETVEANTGAGAGGSQSEGDGIYHRFDRHAGDVRIAGRIVRLGG